MFERAIKPFLVIISIADKRNKIKETQQLFPLTAHFLRFGENRGSRVVKCDGLRAAKLFTFVEKMKAP